MATVLEKLRREGILASEEWVNACLEWIDQTEPNISPAARLLQVQEQWLSADITSEGVQDAPCLPEGLSDQLKCQLAGRYLLQVQYGYDIGNPAYGQLQKIREVDVENQRISADDSQMSQGVGNQTQGEGGYQATQGGRFQAAWEPKPSRMMFLTVTDGFQTIQAMEHEREPKIPDVIKPGAKIELKGPLTCRRGIVLITRNCFKLLGGEVEDLVPMFNLEKVLSGKIGQTEGQKQRPFAQFMKENNRNAPNVPIREIVQNRNAPVVRQNVNVNNETGDGFDEGDDDLLLAASQINMEEAVTSTQLPNRPNRTYHQTQIVPQRVSQTNVNVDFTANDFDDDDDEEALLMAASQVEASAPPRALQVQPKQNKPKSYQQTKIDPSNLFPKPKIPPPRVPLQQKHAANPFVDDDVSFSEPSSSSADTPHFDLIDDDDDELFNSIPDVVVEPEPKQVPDVPFTYLLHLKQTMDKFPTRRLVKTVKAVITTLASKMSIQKSEAGPVWHVSVMLNDGTASLQADISDLMLSSRIGSAAAYLAIPASDVASKTRAKERMKDIAQWLATVSGLFSLRVEAGRPLVEEIVQVGGLHLAQLRRRRLQ